MTVTWRNQSNNAMAKIIGCFIVLFLVFPTHAQTIDSQVAISISGALSARETIEAPEILTESTLNFGLLQECVNHDPNTGTCVWLVCDIFPPNCKIVRNTEVTQFHPATVQFAYNHPGQVPSEFLKTIFEPILTTILNTFTGSFADIEAGGGVSKTNTGRTEVLYKEVSIFTHPGYQFFRSAFGQIITLGGTVCPSIVNTLPLSPLYHSEFNPLGSRDLLRVSSLELPDVFLKPIGGSSSFFGSLGGLIKSEDLGPLVNYVNSTDKGQGGYAISMRELHTYTDSLPTRMGTIMRPLAFRPSCRAQNQSCHTYRMEPGDTNPGTIVPHMPNPQNTCGMLDGSTRFDPNYADYSNRSGNIANSVFHCVRCCPRPSGQLVQLLAQVSRAVLGCDLSGKFR